MSANELIERYANQAHEHLARDFGLVSVDCRDMLAMADLLASQAAEIERLREALEPFARAEHIVANCDDRIRCTLTYPKNATETFTLGSLEAARQALKGTGADHG